MQVPDLRAVFAERLTTARERAAAIEEPALRDRAVALLDELERRAAGDTSLLRDMSAAKGRIKRLVADLLDDMLARLAMRGHVTHGTPAWLDIKHDVLQHLEAAPRPTRIARRMLYDALVYGDVAAVEVLTSPHSRIVLATSDVDLRRLQFDAVTWLVEQREQSGASPLPGVAFVLDQDGTPASLVELLKYAQFLTPIYP